MFGGNNNNHTLPMFLDENQFQLNANAPNHQLQLFGNLPMECTIDPVNYFQNERNNSSILRPNKRAREGEDLSRQQQNLQISLNYNLVKDEIDHCSPSIPNPNQVSTGLRLSYDDDEHNSSVTSASGSMAGTPSFLLSLGDNIRTELERQKDEFDRYIKFQQEVLAKGVKDIKQRHMISFVNTIEDGVNKKLQEKERELENMNQKNSELMERIKQVATEAHNWHYRAKYNESMVNILKNNLQNAISQGVDQVKEGFGDSEVDDATSYMNPTNHLTVAGGLGLGKSMHVSGPGSSHSAHLTCKSCQSREVSVLLMPCRHLCLCKECDGFIRVCPVCQKSKSVGIDVFLS